MKVNTHDFVQEYTLLECIQCGRCTGGCPVSMKTDLNIRSIIYEALIEDCRTPRHGCPVGLYQLPDLLHPLPQGYPAGRRHHWAAGLYRRRGQRRAAPSPRCPDERLHPGQHLGLCHRGPGKWTEELDFEVKNVLDEGQTDLLFYVGCTPAYDPRIQPVTRTLATVFQRAGIDFGTMGMDEFCCGNEIKRIGESEGFESMVEEYPRNVWPRLQGPADGHRLPPLL